MPVLEQDGLGLAAQRRDARPARVGGDESHVAGEIRAAVVAAQDRPFDQLLCHRVGDRVLRLVGLGAAAAAHMSMRALRQRDIDRRGRSRVEGNVAGGRQPRLGRRSRRAAAASGRRRAGCCCGAWTRRRAAVSAAARLGGLRSWLLSWPPSIWLAFGFAVDFLSALGLSDLAFRPSRASSPPAWSATGVALGPPRPRESRARTSSRPRASHSDFGQFHACHAALPDQAARIEIRSQYLFR